MIMKLIFPHHTSIQEKAGLRNALDSHNLQDDGSTEDLLGDETPKIDGKLRFDHTQGSKKPSRQRRPH